MRGGAFSSGAGNLVEKILQQSLAKAASIVRPNGHKKVRFFADKGLFSVTDKAEISIFGDSSELDLKSKLRASRNDLKDLLKPITPTKTVVLQFQLVAAPKPKLKLAHPFYFQNIVMELGSPNK